MTVFQRHPTRSPSTNIPRRAKRLIAGASSLLLAVTIMPGQLFTAHAAVAPVGNGFTVNAADLAFILKQIKIAEEHAVTRTTSNPCGTLVQQPGDGIPDALQIPDRITPYGLRTVDGSCNNLFPDRDKFAAADQPFPRLTDPKFRDAEDIVPSFPVGPPGPTSYKQKLAGNVVIDSQPRVISNLIVDQTSTNPAAIAAAGFPVRTQGNPGLHPCDTVPGSNPPVDITPLTPVDCVPAHQTLFIPNVTTDVGLSPPYNSLFTFFGQFFDHGVDQTVKSGGTVFVPLHADDPLITLGADGIAGTGDEVPLSQAFMVLTRAQNQPGHDGILGTADDIQDANNTDSPWVDQSQTYTSHSSHQFFLREYAMNAANIPVSTGKLLGGLDVNQTYAGSPDGRDGIGTWKAVKLQAAAKFGMQLVDTDVTNIPMIATDPYGKFIPDATTGLPDYVTTTGLVSGNLASPVPVPANVLHFDTPFLTDIAHNADPSERDTNNDGIPDFFPTPDADDTPSADFANQPAGTYDDEMLNAHFSCGDGRCNENIALSTIHQIFHSEHDRLVDYIKNVLSTDTSATGVAALADWQPGIPTSTNGGWNGERLFQAARFVTEMEYQHLVFEEFARKIQPAVRPFHVYNPDNNPAIPAEFAHAVYRFGHSMLDDDVARTNINGSDNSVPLLTAFLNPPEYFNGGTAGTLTPAQAAGSIVMGSSDQTGNELDEFVVETLRNNLLGLPLDLPTLNMTRARSEGIPPLNDVRRQINAKTNDAQMAPYTSWADFGQHLKHPESLVNFVAAYGQHPSITGVTTLAAKRAAAKLLVDPADPTDPAIPADASDFVFSSGTWANGAGGVTTTGLDDVDLWVGGLAEVTNLNGGLLGSTFNYVFQNSLENLQDFDRLYYLNRTQGMNLRTQLEGNSFSELIERNTDGTNTLKADAFATADCKFQLGDLTFPATAAGSPLTPAAKLILGAGSVNDDAATTDCDENRLLLRKPDGTIQYRAINTVDPSGINGQSVYNGTAGVDRVTGGNDNDTFWGDEGNDIIEGNGGDDVALGGDGNDIITDLDGADVLKGGPGNDAIDTGPGDDIFMGGDGQDFMNGGANDNESFAGPGNDFIIAGLGADAVFGDSGDDWIEGGTSQDLLQGDHGAAFFDDPGQVAPGNDLFIGQPGENDYDAEGGDDVMSQNAAIDRNAGSGGFDWAFHQYDTVGADDDMEINNNLVGVPIQVVVNRDRWQETEADSGSAFNDTIKGTSVAPATLGGAGFTGCDVLDQAGLNRISGLDALVPTLTGDPAPVVASSASGFCPVTGPIWGDGDILLGGLGSDTITGRGVDDIIDGDRYLKIKISVRTNPASAASEIGSTDLMEGLALTGNFGPGTTGMTLQQAVFAGLVDPGNLVAVREIVSPTTPLSPDCGATAPTNCDTAVFLAPRASYTIVAVPASASAAASLQVTQTGAVNRPTQKVSDGIDTVRNVERLQFTDQTLSVAVPSAPTVGVATASIGGTTGSATLSWSWTGPVPTGITSYEIVATPTSGPSPVVTRTGISRTLTPLTTNITGLVNGTTYTLQVRAVNQFGLGALSAPSNAVTPAGLPGVPTSVSAVRGNASAAVSWTAPANTGGLPITGYNVQVRIGAAVQSTIALTGTATTTTVTGLTNGTAYNFRVQAVTLAGVSAFSAASPAVTPATTPGAPAIGTAVQGTAGGAVTATANWGTAPNGGSAVLNYQVTAFKMLADGVTIDPAFTPVVVTVAANLRTRAITLPAGSYKFQVAAINVLGLGALSNLSNTVLAR
jgi:Ca2+-binding RTX toxin-like protein